MRNGFLGLALAGCLLAGGWISTASAAETGYKVTADYFSWTVNRGEMDYVYPDTGDVSTVDPGADGGFRLGFEVMKGPATYMIGFATYEAEEEDEVRGGSLSGTLIMDDNCTVCQSFTFATASYDSDFSVIDAAVGYQLRPDSKFGLQFVGGVSFGSIEEEYNVIYADTPAVNGNTDVVEMETEASLFGFTFGLVPTYELADMVSIFGRVSYSPTVADMDRTFVYRDGTTGLQGLSTDFDLELEESEIVHRTDFAAGVEVMPTDWLSLTLGYESNVWLNFPAFLKVTSESGEETIDRGGDGLAYHGWFFQAGYTF